MLACLPLYLLKKFQNERLEHGQKSSFWFASVSNLTPHPEHIHGGTVPGTEHSTKEHMLIAYTNELQMHQNTRPTLVWFVAQSP